MLQLHLRKSSLVHINNLDKIKETLMLNCTLLETVPALINSIQVNVLLNHS